MQPARKPMLVSVFAPDSVRGRTLDNLWWTKAATRDPRFEEALTTALPCFVTTAIPVSVAHVLFYASQIRSLTEFVALDARLSGAGDQR